MKKILGDVDAPAAAAAENRPIRMCGARVALGSANTLAG